MVLCAISKDCVDIIRLPPYQTLNIRTVMFARFARLLMVATLVVMTGAHWAFLQSIAWTTMLADNLSRAPLVEAVSRTFDGKRPCCICKAIAAGKKSEQKHDSSLQLKKFEFPPSQETSALFPPSRFTLLQASNIFSISFAGEPLVPPPRFFYV